MRSHSGEERPSYLRAPKGMDPLLAKEVAYLARYGHIQPSEAMNLDPEERAAICEALSALVVSENWRA